LHKWVA